MAKKEKKRSYGLPKILDHVLCKVTAIPNLVTYRQKKNEGKWAGNHQKNNRLFVDRI